MGPGVGRNAVLRMARPRGARGHTGSRGEVAMPLVDLTQPFGAGIYTLPGCPPVTLPDADQYPVSMPTITVSPGVT